MTHSQDKRRRESEKFQGQPELQKPVEQTPEDRAKQIEDLFWSIDTNKTRAKKEDIIAIIENCIQNCISLKEAKKRGFVPAWWDSVFYPNELLTTNHKTNQLELDAGMMASSVIRHLDMYLDDGLKQGKDFEIAKQKDDSRVICLPEKPKQESTDSDILPA